MDPQTDDLAHALTPHAAFYLDPAGFAAEADRVFARSWQLVGHLKQLATPGDFFTTQVGHESLLLINDAGTLRGFFNVCRHRAGPIAYGCGHASRLVCRYHGWTYDLAGQLLRAPEMEGVADFDARTVHLQPVAVHAFGPLLFAALHATTPGFADYHAGLTAECAPLELTRMRHVLTREYAMAVNWKTYVDNFLEGYHIPLVHPALNRELDYRAYRTQLAPRRVLQFAPVQTASASVYGSTSDGHALYYWLYPNIMLNIYEGQLQTNVVIPVDIDHTIVRFDWYACDPLPNPERDQRFRTLLAFSEQVQAEDSQICEAVQRNFSSRAFRRGRYSVQRESGVHLFHKLVRGD